MLRPVPYDRIEDAVESAPEPTRSEARDFFRSWELLCFHTAMEAMQRRFLLLLIAAPAIFAVSYFMPGGVWSICFAAAVLVPFVALLNRLGQAWAERTATALRAKALATEREKGADALEGIERSIALLETLDPRLAAVTGATLEPEDADGMDWSVPYRIRIRRLLRSQWMFAALALAAGCLGTAGYSVPAIAAAGVAVIFIVLPATVRVMFTMARDTRAFRLMDALRHEEFMEQLPIKTLLQMVSAYDSGEPKAIRFWTKRVLRELLMSKEPDLNPLRASILEDRLLPAWRGWWRGPFPWRTLPAAAEQAFAELIDECGGEA